MPETFVTPLTPLSFLERSSEVWANKAAVLDDDRSLTYAELGEEAMGVALGLRSLGLEPGDRVACLLPNNSPMLVAHFAVPLARCVLVAVNTRLSAEEIRYILEHSGSRVLIADRGFEDLVLGALAGDTDVEQVVWAGDGSTPQGRRRSMSYEDLRARAADGDPLTWTVEDENSVISINYTSGTTGRPKGVMYTHRGAYLNALGEALHSGFAKDSVYLWTLPMFHCNGWCTPWAITAVGARHVCLREVRPEVIWDRIRNAGVTHLNAAPTVITSMLNATTAGRLESPVQVTTAGAPPSPTTIGQMEEKGFAVTHVYGLTEVYGPYAVCEEQAEWADLEPSKRARLIARQGVGMIQAERVRVVDSEMKDVPADGVTMGEIVMRGNNVMKGYFKDAEGTAKAFAGGWFHSGDLGVMHPDGYVELRDRKKDIVISGGENISTVEVEQALMSHPAVLEVAVVGVPDEKWGERPKAFVIPKAGRTPSPEELIAHVRSKIAHYKAPREVVLVPELPKTSTGKIQKFVLRDGEWAGHDKRIQG
ncbi:acyl--CoA ligase family protein [Streptomyces hirsutus]|uniref:Acyl--CoA ligase family protein n=1 Tax=Streptomyces hirsutus TaxID=35620 RepID=A0ABZ1GVP1_9ACTN|nr:acyl--CoA ligase family protein [Streptomyces hirsutus]WSD10164.1 acyl--CoA ligase family protein [Streptomyces hirsutus]